MSQTILAVGIALWAIAYTVVGWGYLTTSYSGQLSPGLLPLVIGGLAIPFGLINLWFAVREWRQEHFHAVVNRPIVETLAAMVVLALLFSTAGFMAAGVAFTLFLLYRFYSHNWVICLAYGILLPGVLLAVFEYGLQVPLP